MIPGQGAHDFFVFVQHGIAAVAALEHHLPDVVDVIIQVEAHDLSPLARAGDGDGLVDQAAGAAGGEGGGDDACVAVILLQSGVDIRPADDEAADVLVQGPLDHIRLAGHQNDIVAAGKAQVLRSLGHGHHHVAADVGGHTAALVDDAALQHADQVEHRQLLHLAVHQRLHAEGGDVAGGEHAVQSAVVIHNGDGGDALVAHHMPGPVHGDGGAEAGGRIVLQVADLGADRADGHRLLKAEMPEHAVGLVADVAQVRRHILPVAQSVAQGGIGHGRHNGIRIRIAVAGYKNLVHGFSSRELFPHYKAAVFHFQYEDIINFGYLVRFFP